MPSGRGCGSSGYEYRKRKTESRGLERNLREIFMFLMKIYVFDGDLPFSPRNRPCTQRKIWRFYSCKIKLSCIAVGCILPIFARKQKLNDKDTYRGSV